MRRVFYHAKVPSEVRDIVAWYDAISPKLGNEFWTELKTVLEYARAFPERHHFDPSGRRRANLKKFPYHILFRVFDSHIRVTIVRHNRRDPTLGSRRT